jgi:hypothetical protein
MNPNDVSERMKLQEGELLIHLGNRGNFHNKLNSLHQKLYENSKKCLVDKLEFEWNQSLIAEIQEKLDELEISERSLGFDERNLEDNTLRNLSVNELNGIEY